ncbi:glycosyltransferase [Falsiruegeria mediterranea]|uniref:Glycosyl transferase family 1 domain-containing protein n=1 Tax=Falsiruegeria mediterranea M17 TaxID=1200281 RepID=A0A2R8CFZ4_9RHOB|nr:glycosyltransferase [Falsiruegeria mediterranea]SPJ31340.1 hypothetical protein TRM7615_04883 [Falsiruegeria mediterranea M17]
MRVAILAEQNFNLIDGSTIWLLNVCKLLALQPDLTIDLVLTHRLDNRVLAQELPDTIRVYSADVLLETAGIADAQLRPETVVDVMRAWEAQTGPYDRIFVRGADYLTRLLNTPELRDRIVAYAPSAIPDLGAPEPEWVRLARATRTRVVVQSDTAKHAMEALLDYPAYVVHVVPPIVFQPDTAPQAWEGPATLCYSGKIDLHYGLDWLIDLCEEVAEDPQLNVQWIAGKDTHRPRYRPFFKVMDSFRARLADGALPGISLLSNIPHAEAKDLMRQASLAYCLRHDRYDDVIEISTKIVEFCTLGVPPILNDNALNRALFGDDYPYLVDIAQDEIAPKVLGFLRNTDSADYARAQERIAEIARQFSAESLSDSLSHAIRGYLANAPVLTDTPRKIMIATHERKFLRQFLDRVRGDSNVEITWETWKSTIKPLNRPHVPDDVDTVLCEWCCQNAVWHSNNKRPGTRLIVRLHRFEAFREFPALVQWDNVDALIVVSDWFRDRAIERYGIAPERVHVMPQYIDWHGLQRPKLPEARFTLGLVGINPFEHKRFDRAIDFFKALRQRDSRFQLAVRSSMPWEIQWVWDRQDDTRAKFEETFQRIFTDPDLASSIRFDPAGQDMEEWYRGIGVILSSSDSEGCHTSVIEGLASGCLPVVHDWPGARSLFDPHVYADMAKAIPAVIAFADDPETGQTRETLASSVACHDVENFAQNFMKL